MEEVNADRETHGKKLVDDVYDKAVEQFSGVHVFVADSVYKTPHICNTIFSDGRVLSTAEFGLKLLLVILPESKSRTYIHPPAYLRQNSIQFPGAWHVHTQNWEAIQNRFASKYPA